MGPWMAGPLDAVHEETVELCVMEQGMMHVRLGERCGTQRAGEVAVIPPRVRHGSWTEKEPAREVIVHLDAAELAARCPGAVPQGIWGAADHPAAAAIGDAVAEQPETVADLALALLEHVCAHAPQVVANDPRIVAAAEAVAGSLERAWTVADMAEIAGMSEAHFARRFREVVGSSPMRYLQQQRLGRAQWLMNASNASITEIALRVGFGSPSRFSEAFTQRHGVSPSRWRAQQA